MRLSNLLVAVSMLAAATGTTALARPNPLGSSFSYQGKLQQAGTPYNGTADFQFSLWENVSGVPQVGATLPVSGVVVTNGIFTASLDFGMLAFNGQERWLEITVHTPSNGGAGPYTPLTPRQRLDAVPYALYAINALIAGAQPNQVALNNTANTYSGSSMTLDGGTFHVDAANNRVGIGTTSPESALHVANGGVLVDDGYQGFLLKSSSGGPIVGGMRYDNVGVSDALWIANYQAGPLIFATHTSPGIAFGHVVLTPSGRLGIDAGMNPGAKLHVRDGGSGTSPNAASSSALERNAANYLNILAPDANETGILFGKPTNGAEAGGIIYNSPGTPDGLQFRTGGNATRASIDSTGRMLLASAQSGPSLLGLYNSNDQPSGITLGTAFRTWFLAQNQPPDDGSALDAFYIFDSSANTTRMLITTAGNVGIGTTAPGTKLHIINPNAAMNSLQSVNTAAAGTDVGSGVVGITSQASASAAGVRGLNTNATGTGVIGAGNNVAWTVLPAGSGGAFTGVTTGAYARSTTGGAGEGLYTDQFGAVVRVNYWSGTTQYKINGAGTVSTIVRDVQDKPITMFAPEAPEVLFNDYGEAVLLNGFAHVELDADFARNVVINAQHPLRVFIQLEDNENCQGVVIKNKTAHGFDVVELRGGLSNTPFQYQITCNRADEVLPSGRLSKYADLRFPLSEAPAQPLTAAADLHAGQVTAQPQKR